MAWGTWRQGSDMAGLRDGAAGRSLDRRNRGASALTYGLIVGLVGLGSLAAVSRVGTSVDSLFGGAASSMTRGLGTPARTQGGSPVRQSCQAHRDAGETADGPFSINPDGGSAFEAWCDFDGSEGWTLALRTANGGNRFGYFSGHWDNDTTVAGALDPLDPGDLKSAAFNLLPGTHLRACFQTVATGAYGCLTESYASGSGVSLLSLFRDTPPNTLFFQGSTSGYDAGALVWLTIWGEDRSSLYPGGDAYAAAGVNVFDDLSNWDAKVRLGMMINGQSNRNSGDSTVGFGADGAHTSGNDIPNQDSPGSVSAGWSSYNGEAVNRTQPTRGQLWVR